MPAPDPHSMLLQAGELAAVKNSLWEEACRRVADAERALAAVRAEMEVRAGSARSANELVVALQEQIRRRAGTGPQMQAGAPGLPLEYA